MPIYADGKWYKMQSANYSYDMREITFRRLDM